VVEDEPETRRLRAAASERARGFDWSVTVDRHRALYREVTGR
jgi:glycosyltransferase involved in cell wall biosynthesis